MLTDPQLPRGFIQNKAQRTTGNHFRLTRAFSLLEVMIAATIFTMTSVSIGALYVQNNRMAMVLRYRTSATNVALNVLEQIRVLEFDKINTLYIASKPATPEVTQAFIRVIVADPNAPNLSTLPPPNPTSTTAPGFGVDPIPLKFQNIDVIINARDDVIKNATWTSFPNGLPLVTTAGGVRMPMKFWLTLKYTEAVSGDPAVIALGQVFEIILVYQWQQPSHSSTAQWESGTVRAVIQNPNPAVIRS